jgi:response regulator of citrate/malate metabolism
MGMYGVLVVEDKQIIARQLASCVTASRWFDLVGVAGTSQQAIDIARREKPDLVLLDLSLPDSVADGFGVWDVLHKLAKVPDVIAVTGAGEVSVVELAQRYGACDYALKPVTRATITAKLDNYAYNRKQRPAVTVCSNQGQVDGIFEPRKPRRYRLPAGLQEATMNSVVCVLRAAPRPLRAAEVGEQVGIDRVTANRYLTYLCEEGIAERVPEHGRPGHPAFLYTLAPVWTPETRS